MYSTLSEFALLPKEASPGNSNYLIAQKKLPTFSFFIKQLLAGGMRFRLLETKLVLYLLHRIITYTLFRYHIYKQKQLFFARIAMDWN